MLNDLKQVLALLGAQRNQRLSRSELDALAEDMARRERLFEAFGDVSVTMNVESTSRRFVLVNGHETPFSVLDFTRKPRETSAFDADFRIRGSLEIWFSSQGYRHALCVKSGDALWLDPKGVVVARGSNMGLRCYAQ
jgi:hypothetical protein